MFRPTSTLSKRVSVVRDPITRFDADKFKTQFACEVKDWDPLEHFDRKEARKLDPYAQYGMVGRASSCGPIWIG